MTTLQEFIEQECELVIQGLCSTHLVSRAALLSGTKTVQLVRIRRAAIKQLLERGFSYKQIGKAIGRNRATIYYWSGARFRERQRRNMREYYAKTMEMRP